MVTPCSTFESARFLFLVVEGIEVLDVRSARHVEMFADDGMEWDRIGCVSMSTVGHSEHGKIPQIFLIWQLVLLI